MCLLYMLLNICCQKNEGLHFDVDNVAVKCYDNKMVKSLVDLTIIPLVGARGGVPTKHKQKKTLEWGVVV